MPPLQKHALRALLVLLGLAACAARADNPAAENQALPEFTAVPAESQEALRRAAMGGTPASLPPVTARMYQVKGRLELQPLFAVSFGDPFFRSIMAGVRGEVHLDERWSLGLHVFGGLSAVSAPVQLCGAQACSAPDAARLRSAPGDLQLVSGMALGFRPVYGKLSVLGEKTVHFDAWLELGPELVRERIAPDAATAAVGRWEAGARFSAGERLYLSNQLTVRLGASELVWGSHVRGRVELERKLTIEAGLAWLFGAPR